MPGLFVFVVISLVLIGVTNADVECANSELLSIAANKNVAGCSKVAGFSSMSTIANLSSEQLKAVCGSSACVAMMKDLVAMGFGDCRIPDSQIHLQSDIIDPFNNKCSAVGSTDSSSNSSSSSSSTSSAAASAFCRISMIMLALVTMLKLV
ncbi:hypothetical protein PF005_g1674 [Phytophthora fragariae]|uniref:Elicitin n=1 Tax=Phytophthora fragariae TaxID=53985 RepID=A0A6A3ZDW9_9STRA|nr:hypothetical protein PF003_g35133 [Phytophthora fragariae]KAE8948722.1 hypothetical protein PF009_g1728 [Phytophthora fragariae]KAE9008051.1 hypothetical protein PF011_g10865 [Phytophthora fragariae]KAE9105909.1 hypothetical protein PF007_g13603 [Phytophthora fragariae]KAE9138368.1 hypothetical protein PF010_g1006 [Phytophthora fragariae]